MSEILTREEYAERINDAYFDQGMGMATHDVLLHHDAALRAALDTAGTFLRRILAADMTGNEAERNHASGEAALYLAKRAREARNG